MTCKHRNASPTGLCLPNKEEKQEERVRHEERKNRETIPGVQVQTQASAKRKGRTGRKEKERKKTPSEYLVPDFFLTGPSFRTTYLTGTDKTFRHLQALVTSNRNHPRDGKTT
ncbi:hypothetical protein RUM44_008347 [Polyplax serrata]|uniref:Uncharacterized protein n=1 Tax=Polyplax serrata TaxID=468196 RepID=A0ABR1B821_POLSC